jgi:His-Xaa-Ser system radical SAM maturase HxsB
MNEKKSRKFRSIDSFSNKGQYYLLPFKFLRLENSTELIVNEVGDYLIFKSGTVEKIINKELNKNIDFDLYGDLISNFIISEEPISNLIDIIAYRYRTKKSFLYEFTSLHIFVLTLRCEHSCNYCQVSRVSEDHNKYDMSKENLDRYIDFMFKSPNKNLTMEFQGGEPLLVFELIKYSIIRTEEINLSYKKNIKYVVCTNLVLIDIEKLEFFKTYDVVISTSLDGPEFLHNKNRVKPNGNSYQSALRGIEISRKYLGEDKVSALMTTTQYSLNYPIEIVDEYFNLGFKNIFIRPLSPYGFAKNKYKSYDSQDFLNFYKKAFNRILHYNKLGNKFIEDYAQIILTKLITPFTGGYVDLSSPNGGIINSILFNYDGSIYTSDEGRMLSEMNDFSFRLGNIQTHSYDEIIFGSKSQEFSRYSVNEGLTGCSDCALQLFCGADPINNYSTSKSMVGIRPKSDFCNRNMNIILLLINYLEDQENKDILSSWVN